MIFDSEIMRKWREKYADEPNFRVPKIVFLDRYEGLAEERLLLERLVRSLPEPERVRKDLLGRLLNIEDAQFLGAWFQIRLFGWLQQVGAVVIEPGVMGNHPDFSLNVADQELVIEARAVTFERDELQKFVTSGRITVIGINSETLKAPLREKAKQHKALRKAGYPYVLAILLESPLLSVEEVVEAWLGRTEAVVDFESDRAIAERSDQSGLHFFGSEIRHRTVSGTLVFRIDDDENMRRYVLRSWYVQNPYANVPIDVDLFPVESRYIVLEETPSGYTMGWR